MLILLCKLSGQIGIPHLDLSKDYNALHFWLCVCAAKMTLRTPHMLKFPEGWLPKALFASALLPEFALLANRVNSDGKVSASVDRIGHGTVRVVTCTAQ